MSNSSIVGRLQTELQEESQTRQIQQQLNSKLQNEYDHLLKRLAEAENHIDRLRLGANVTLNKHFVITHEHQTLGDRLGAQFDPNWRLMSSGTNEANHPPTANVSTGTEFNMEGSHSKLDQDGHQSSHNEETLPSVQNLSLNNPSNSQSPQHYTLNVHTPHREQPHEDSQSNCLEYSQQDLSTDGDDTGLSQMSTSSVMDRVSAESIQYAHLLKIKSLQGKVDNLKSKLNERGSSFDEVLTGLNDVQYEHRELSEEIVSSQAHMDSLNERYGGKASERIAKSNRQIGNELATLAGQLQGLQKLLQTKVEDPLIFTPTPASPLHTPHNKSGDATPLPGSSATESALHAQIKQTSSPDLIDQTQDSASEVGSDLINDLQTSPFLASKYFTSLSQTTVDVGSHDMYAESHDVSGDQRHLSQDHHSLSHNNLFDNDSSGHESNNQSQATGHFQQQPVPNETYILKERCPLDGHNALRSTLPRPSHIPRAVPIHHHHDTEYVSHIPHYNHSIDDTSTSLIKDTPAYTTCPTNIDSRSDELLSHTPVKPADIDSGLAKSSSVSSLNARNSFGERSGEDYSTLTMSAIDRLRAELDQLKDQIKNSQTPSVYTDSRQSHTPTSHKGSSHYPPHTHSALSSHHTTSTQRLHSARAPSDNPPHTHFTHGSHGYGSSSKSTPAHASTLYTSSPLPTHTTLVTSPPLTTSTQSSPRRSVHTERVTTVDISPKHVPISKQSHITPTRSYSVRSTPHSTPYHRHITEASPRITPSHDRVYTSKTTPMSTPAHTRDYPIRMNREYVARDVPVRTTPSRNNARSETLSSRRTGSHYRSTDRCETPSRFSSHESTPHRSTVNSSGQSSHRAVYRSGETPGHLAKHNERSKSNAESTEFKSPRHHPHSYTSSRRNSGFEKSTGLSKSSSLEQRAVGDNSWSCPRCGGKGSSTVSTSPGGTRTHIHTHKCTQVYPSPVHTTDHSTQVDIDRHSPNRRHDQPSFAQVATSTPTKTENGRRTPSQERQRSSVHSSTTPRRLTNTRYRDDYQHTNVDSTPHRFEAHPSPVRDVKIQSRDHYDRHQSSRHMSTEDHYPLHVPRPSERVSPMHYHCRTRENTQRDDLSRDKTQKGRERVVYVSRSPSDYEELYHSEPGARDHDLRQERPVLIKKRGRVKVKGGRRVHMRPGTRKVYVVGGAYSGESDSDSGPDVEVIEGRGLDLDKALRLAKNLKRRSRKMHGSLRDLAKLNKY